MRLIATAAFLLAACATGAAAQEEASDEGAEPRNAMAFKAGYIHIVNKHRDTRPGEPAPPETDDLGGFVFAYERVLSPGLLTVELVKAFYFGKERFDSPFEAYLKLVHRWGAFEPYLGLGVTFNVRVFEAEREEIEGESVDLSFGLAGTGGCVFRLTERWGLDAELGYAWIPVGNVAQHEVTATLGPLYAF